MRLRRTRIGVAVTFVALLSSAGAMTGAAAASTSRGSATKPHRGGSLTVLEDSINWTTLDPATNVSDGIDWSYMDAIYGQLFQRVGTKQGAPESAPDLATGYRYIDHNKTIVIKLRRGVTFSDGTPFDASAVVYNWKRDLRTTCSCNAMQLFLQKAKPLIQVVGKYALSIHLTYPDATFINALQDSQLDWIGSPSAEKRMGSHAFGMHPVGAGPFIVTSNTPGSELSLARNRHYYQKGLPYLNHLTFKNVANDETAYEAMVAGSGQAYEDMVTPQLASSFKKHFQVTVQPSDAIVSVQFNTRVAPFNNIKARKAVLYATDAALLDQKLFHNATPLDETFIERGGLFYKSSKVPGYEHYDLSKARKLVKKLGGLNFKMFAPQTPALKLEMEALASMWKAAGINATISSVDFPDMEANYFSQKWQAALHAVGNADPALATGVNLMYGPLDKGMFSGVEYPPLNKILKQAAETISPAARKHLYWEASKMIAREAFGAFLYSVYDAQIAAKGVGGPGLTTVLPPTVNYPQVLWQYVYYNK